MSFEDELRRQTRTQQEIRSDQQSRQQEEIVYIASVFARAFANSCKGAASSGRRSIRFRIPTFVHRQVYDGSICETTDEKIIRHNEYFVYSCTNLAAHLGTSSFFSPGISMQTFNTEDRGAVVQEHYCYSRSYADALAKALKQKLVAIGFKNASVAYDTGREMKERHFWKEVTVFKPHSERGVNFFFMDIMASW